MEVAEDLVPELLRAQFPQWEQLPCRDVTSGGTDNVMFRLGPELAVRLPRTARAAERVERELAWLPVLGPQLPVPIPKVVAVGEPNERYPFRWGILRWLEGQPWSVAAADNLTDTAEQLADFVLAMRAVDARGAPRPGPGRQGAPLAQRDASVQMALEALEGSMDTAPIRRAWQIALQAPAWVDPPVWIHGDLLPGNVLVHDRRLAAVIDFGLACVGDPAMDVIAAWSLFGPESREVYRTALAVDDATWERARGWALAGVEGIAYYARTNPGFAAECQRRVDAALEDL